MWKTTLLKVLGMLDKPEKERCFIKEKIQKKYMEQNWQKSDEQNFLLFSGLLSYGQFIDKR